MGTTANGQIVVAGGVSNSPTKVYESIEQSNNEGASWTPRNKGLSVPMEYAAMAEVPENTFTC